ncbi:GGDEF domain-containing protein [Novosphingobium beihaiensis]|uniref:diguanylate cyclase n=1 Tax=Novosphingobium beihaiensis TaxID=2930389 RepID=A0ABT0BPB6_9SPHN|nr:GGDEF domain-containing protein [Novosphingobium beihaiensis]MCJ2186925.1 GGDEF domain-containing protein [Novosphingobium beihaiensis]
MLKGLLGLGRNAEGPDSGKPHGKASGASARDLARQQLIDDIGTFLIGNDLDISEANLTAAFGICSGSTPAVAQKYTELRAEGHPVTQTWIDEQRGGTSDTIARIADKLDRSLEDFASTSRDARKTAAQYSSEMQVHVEKASEMQEREEIRNLATLAMAMLERTQHLEQEMHRSEREAAALRRRLAKARRDADHDHLTGLPNRRAFEGLLTRQYAEAERRHEALSVAFCDIDNFKRINDIHGHDTGDRVIQAIAGALAKISDDNCHVARHGGEEFVMLFRGLDKVEAALRLDEVRETFAKRSFVNRQSDEPIGQISFSAGVADVFAYPSSRDALKAADVALYAAKAQGRNRIVTAG